MYQLRCFGFGVIGPRWVVLQYGGVTGFFFFPFSFHFYGTGYLGPGWLLKLGVVRWMMLAGVCGRK